MLRAIILSMVLFLALGMIGPIATEQTDAAAVQRQKRKYKKKRRATKYRKYRKYRRSKKYRSSRRYRSSKRRYKAKKRYRRAKSRYRKSRKRSVRRYRKARKYSAKRRVNRKRKVRKYRKARKYNAKRRVDRKRKVRKYRKARKYTAKRRVSRKPRVRKYSKKWWRQYRARQARRKAVAKRKRALRLKRIRLAKKKRSSKARRIRNQRAAAQPRVQAQPRQAAMLPSGNPAPSGWVQNDVSSSSLLFNVDGGNGSQIGSASLTVLGPATGQTVTGWRNSSVGGVPTTALRRTVIDQMIRENGWVENDYQKEIAGKSVYVVVAKSADSNNRVESRTYYFTEANGRIYSLATKSSKEDSEKIVRQSEKVLESLQNRGTKVQRAKN